MNTTLRIMPDLSNATEMVKTTSEQIVSSFGREAEDQVKEFNTLYPVNTVEVESIETLDLGNIKSLVMRIRLVVPGISKLGFAQMNLNMYANKANAYKELYDEAYIHAIEQFGIFPTQDGNTEDKDPNVIPDNTKEVSPVATATDNKSTVNYSQPGATAPVVPSSQVNPSAGVPNIPTEAYQGTPVDNPVKAEPAQQANPTYNLDEEESPFGATGVPTTPTQPTAPVQQATPQVQAPTTTSQPEARDGSQFTPEQIKAMTEFKASKNIPNNEILLSYIQAWNNKFQGISQLSREELDQFLAWTKQGSLNL